MLPLNNYHEAVFVVLFFQPTCGRANFVDPLPENR